MVTKDYLLDKLALIKEQIPQDEWVNYHIESIENFIFHLDSIESHRTRARTAKGINVFLDIIEQKSKQHHDPAELYRELNRSYIWNLSHVYTDGLGFILKPDYPLFFLIMIISYFVLKLFIASNYALSIIVIYVVYRIIYTTVKIRARKFY